MEVGLLHGTIINWILDVSPSAARYRDVACLPKERILRRRVFTYRMGSGCDHRGREMGRGGCGIEDEQAWQQHGSVGVRAFPAYKSLPLQRDSQVYFRIRQDLAELGLTFPCPRNLSSGIHSLIIATQICRRVNMFGFTYSTDVLKTRPGHMDKPHTMHDAHSWENDVMLIRLLHLAGLINICTADDPSMDLQTIRSGETLVV